MARKIVDYECDLVMTNTTIDPPFIFNLEGIDEITIESSSFLGIAWVASTATLEITNDIARGNWKAMPSGAITITSVAITNTLNVSAARWGRLRVTAGAASDFTAHFDIHGEGMA